MDLYIESISLDDIIFEMLSIINFSPVVILCLIFTFFSFILVTVVFDFEL